MDDTFKIPVQIPSSPDPLIRNETAIEKSQAVKEQLTIPNHAYQFSLPGTFFMCLALTTSRGYQNE